MNKEKETKRLDAEELEKRVAPMALQDTTPGDDPSAPSTQTKGKDGGTVNQGKP